MSYEWKSIYLSARQTDWQTRSQTLRHQRTPRRPLVLVQRRALIFVKINLTLGSICISSVSLCSGGLVIRGAILQIESGSLNPFDSKRLPCCWISTSVHRVPSVSVSACGVYFSTLPDVRHQGCFLAVDADDAFDSLVTAASWSSLPAQCSPWQRLQALPFLTCTKVVPPARLRIITLVMSFRTMLCCDPAVDCVCSSLTCYIVCRFASQFFWELVVRKYICLINLTSEASFIEKSNLTMCSTQTRGQREATLWSSSRKRFYSTTCKL